MSSKPTDYERFGQRRTPRAGEYTMGTIIIWFCAVTISYWLVFPFVSVTWLNDIPDGSLIALSALVCVKYATWSMLNWWRTTDRVLMARIGIAGTAFVTFGWRISRFLYAEKLFGPAVIGVHDGWRGYMIVLACMFYAMLVVAIGMDNGRPRRYYINLCLASAIGGAIAITAMKLSH